MILTDYEEEEQLYEAYIIDKMVDFSEVFNISFDFMFKKEDNVRRNIEALEKIEKAVKYSNKPISKDVQKFIKNMIMRGYQYEVISGFKNLKDFILGFNRVYGYFDYKKAYEGSKYNYLSVTKIPYHSVLTLSIKSDKVDKAVIYIIANVEVIDECLSDIEYYQTNEVFDRKMIKDLKLKPKMNKSKALNYDNLSYEFFKYYHCVYDNIENEDTFIKYLIRTYWDNYSNYTFYGFIEYLTNKGYQIKHNEVVEEVKTNSFLIDMVYYNAVITFMNNNFKGYIEFKNRLNFLIEKEIKFNKVAIKVLFGKYVCDLKSQQIYNELSNFLDDL